MKIFFEKCKLAAIILGHLISTLMWSRRIVRRARPAYYIADGLLIYSAFVAALWVV